MAVLPHQHQHAVDRADAEQVEQHRLGGQQQRAERPGQQHEGHRGDDCDHQREAAIDGAGEVDVEGTVAADLHARKAGSRLAHPGDGLPAGWGAGLDDRLDAHQGGAVAAPGGLIGRERGAHARHTRKATGHLGRVGAGGDQHLQRSEDPGGQPGVLQGDQARPGWAGGGQRFGPGRAEHQAERGDAQGDEDRQRRQRRQPADADHAAGPGRPAAAGVRRLAAPGPVDPAAGRGQQHRQQGKGDQHADQGISMPARPMLRSRGTGSNASETRPIATVPPLNSTARPAVAMARRTACSPCWPLASSSRQRVTSSRQ